jgi:hypothetical protein
MGLSPKRGCSDGTSSGCPLRQHGNYSEKVHTLKIQLRSISYMLTFPSAVFKRHRRRLRNRAIVRQKKIGRPFSDSNWGNRPAMRSTISSTLPTSGPAIFCSQVVRGAKANIRGQPDAKTAVKPPSTASITFPGSHSFCHQPALRFVTKGRFAPQAAIP